MWLNAIKSRSSWKLSKTIIKYCEHNLSAKKRQEVKLLSTARLLLAGNEKVLDVFREELSAPKQVAGLYLTQSYMVLDGPWRNREEVGEVANRMFMHEGNNQPCNSSYKKIRGQIKLHDSDQ